MGTNQVKVQDPQKRRRKLLGQTQQRRRFLRVLTLIFLHQHILFFLFTLSNLIHLIKQMFLLYITN